MKAKELYIKITTNITTAEGAELGTELDEVDLAIIRALQKDARASFAAIAKSCDVSVDTISKRFKKIEAYRRCTREQPFC